MCARVFSLGFDFAKRVILMNLFNFHHHCQRNCFHRQNENHLRRLDLNGEIHHLHHQIESRT